MMKILYASCRYDPLDRDAGSGVDYVCVGSAILKAQSPKEAFLKIKGLVNE